MANPEAVMRAAQKPPMGGMPPGKYDDGKDAFPGQPNGPAGAPPAPEAPKPPEGGQGMDGMVQALQGVGEFLKAQGPGAEEAMGHFQALLQSMASMGGAPGGQPGGPAPLERDGGGPGRVHESKAPGVQVL